MGCAENGVKQQSKASSLCRNRAALSSPAALAQAHSHWRRLTASRRGNSMFSDMLQPQKTTKSSSRARQRWQTATQQQQHLGFWVDVGFQVL